MSSQKEIILNTIKDIKDTIDLFYQQKETEALEKFQLIIGEIMNSMDALFEYKNLDANFEFDEKKLTAILTDAMNALQDRDLVLLADILQYDFLEYLQEIVENMK